MTQEEATRVQAATPRKLLFHPVDDRFVFLRGHPCPLLSTDGALAVCTVWPVRPYNCRRFGCFRPDPPSEPFEPEPLDLERGRLGCGNLSDRLTNRQVRRAYALMQRRAQRWALAHGWTNDDAHPPRPRTERLSRLRVR